MSDGMHGVEFALAVQSDKTTPATTGFIRGRMGSASMWTEFKKTDNEVEDHSLNDRPTARKSKQARTTKIVRVRAEGYVYPDILPLLMAGMGFEIATVDITTYKTQNCTIADIGAVPYLTVLLAHGKGSDRYERRGVGLRFSRITLTSEESGIKYTVEGIALDESTAAGTETVAVETDAILSPSLGSITYGTLALGAPRSHTITFERTVAEDDHKQHSFGLNDLPVSETKVSGELRGLELTFDKYKALTWAGGATPDNEVVLDSLVYSWASPVEVVSGTPYAASFTFNECEFETADYDSGPGKVYLDATYTMNDRLATDPLTVSVDNGVTSY